jgi:hypothetical protein
MKKSILFLFVLSAFMMLQSCEDGLAPGRDDNPDNLTVPALPPAEMFAMPVSELQNMEAELDESHTRGDTYENWLHAGLSVFGWNAIIVINLAVPVSAIGQAFNVDAQYIGNNTFEWAYTYQAPANLGGDKYNISLTAEYINTTEIEWNLVASQQGGFQDFVWLSAVIANDHTYANYTLRRNPENPEDYLGVHFERVFSFDRASLRFTNVLAGDPGQGHYIEYRVDESAVFNRAFELQAGPDNILQAEWDEPTHIGRVKHLQYFGDNDWRCWDEKLVDVDC